MKEDKRCTREQKPAVSDWKSEAKNGGSCVYGFKHTPPRKIRIPKFKIQNEGESRSSG
jgi:hypothetical protein